MLTAFFASWSPFCLPKWRPKTLGRDTFGRPSAYLEPSWRQVAIFIDFRRVLAPLGSLRGLSWEGFGPILAPSRAYLDPPCGCFLLSPGCLGFPILPFPDLPGCLSQAPTTSCHSKSGIAATNCRAQNEGRRLLPQRGFQLNQSLGSFHSWPMMYASAILVS